MQSDERNARLGFTGWLLTQQHRDDPIGDLACDVAADPNWPADDGSDTPDIYARYITALGGPSEFVRDAWRAYQRALAEEE